MKNFKNLNNIFGWGVFFVALIVYLLTIECTVSLWDCGEYITSAYKLEVGHPPGAPLFMILGRLFSFFAAPEYVALCINSVSAISSSFTILFMFWSLSLLIRKMIRIKKPDLDKGDELVTLIGAAIGSLAYTFSDSFWFSAVEGEVYAMASLFTAVIFWAVLKWDEEMARYQAGEKLEREPNRWLLFIMFLLGLAIGVHLLGILVVPAIGYIIYFRIVKNTNLKGMIITGLVSIFALGFIQEGIIPGSISIASSFEVFFVNSMGMPFYSGTIFFFALLVYGLFWGVKYARKKGKTILYNSLMGLVFLLIGYGSFAVIVIRSNANTPLDENDPENLVTLHSYLKREQYGYTPLLSGPYWNSKANQQDEWKNASPSYLRRFVVIKDNEEIKAFTKEDEANAYAEEVSGLVEEKYFASNRTLVGEDKFYQPMKATYPSDQTTIFPRMYSDEDRHIRGYKNWSGYNPSEEGSPYIGEDGKRLPTFGENLRYFFRYQINWMYTRYFMWNFAGRQNDIQGHGDQMRGNWISGIGFIDNARLGNQDEAPYYTKENPSNNKYYFIPLILALVGLFFHFYKSPKDAFVVLLAFLFTGLAIVLYLNQKPFEPRERDYAYAGSFYFFAMWIGIGVYAIYDVLTKKKWISNGIVSASLSGALGLVVPILMATQGWDDHDRSGKTSAKNLALNYLESCSKNAILFTNGDNDTFPLWYMQEVEGKRTDVRVCNLSLMGTDWYTNQMKMKAYDSDPLPIKFQEDQILMLAGNTDQIYFLSMQELVNSNNDKLINSVLDLRLKNNLDKAKMAVRYFDASAAKFLAQINSRDEGVNKAKGMLMTTDTSNIKETIINKFKGFNNLVASMQNSKMEEIEKISAQKTLQKLDSLIQDFEYPDYNYMEFVDQYGAKPPEKLRDWSAVDLSEAMAFVRNDANAIENGSTSLSFFPSKKFSLKVNKQNALATGTIQANQLASCPERINFSYNEEGRFLTKSEIMMLDVLANNDWKRGIYFSSNRGSSLSLSLLKSGYIKQVGVAYELNPVIGEFNEYTGLPSLFDADKMYKNLTKVYTYGDLKNPDVLTDYYARRHTIQYRLCFLQLAEEFYFKGKKAEDSLAAATKVAISKPISESQKSIWKTQMTENFAKTEKLLDMAMEILPFETVLDFGEVGAIDPLGSLSLNSKHSYYDAERKVQAYASGHLHEYVQLYTLIKKFDKASALATKVLGSYETIFGFFQNSDPSLAANPENAEDLHAALDACFKIQTTAQNAGYTKLAQEAESKIKLVYKKTRSIVDALSGSDEGKALDLRLQLMRSHYWKKEEELNPKMTR